MTWFGCIRRGGAVCGRKPGHRQVMSQKQTKINGVNFKHTPRVTLYTFVLLNTSRIVLGVKGCFR